MYEIMKWGDVYPKLEFIHEWDFASFVDSVQSGNTSIKILKKL